MESLLKGFDNISGRIDLTFQGRKGYKTLIGGLFTLIIYILTFFFSVLFLHNMLLRIDPRSYSVKKYIDSGKASLSPDNLFHFISLINKNSGEYLNFSAYMKYFEIESMTLYGSGKIITKYKYDKCTKYDFDPIPNLYSESYSNYYCIRKMLNIRNNTPSTGSLDNIHATPKISDMLMNDENNYQLNFYNLPNQDNTNGNLKLMAKNVNVTNINDNSHKRLVQIESDEESNNNIKINTNFVYPWMTMENTENPSNLIYYEINFSKCTNSTIKEFCKSNEEINQLIDSVYFKIKFVDSNLDISNYDTPLRKFINGKYYSPKSDYLLTINMNFLSVNLVTKDNIIFDKGNTLKTYAFDYQAGIFTNAKDNIFHKIQFYFSNNVEVFERSYPRIENVISDIVGIYKVLFTIATILNYILEKYINNIINENLFDILKMIPSKKSNNSKSDLNKFSIFSQIKMNEEFNNKRIRNAHIISDEENNEFELQKFKNLSYNNNMMYNNNLNSNNFSSEINNINKSSKQLIIDNLNKFTFMKIPPNNLSILNENVRHKTYGIDRITGNHRAENSELNGNVTKIIVNRKKNYSFFQQVSNNNANPVYGDSNLRNNEKHDVIRTQRDYIINENERSSFKPIVPHKPPLLKCESEIKRQIRVFSKKKFVSLSGTIPGFFKFLFRLMSCKRNKKNEFANKIRNFFLDEINLYILHIEVAKIKKILIEDLNQRGNSESDYIDINEILDYYSAYIKFSL